jgi:SRSO17 transposase
MRQPWPRQSNDAVMKAVRDYAVPKMQSQGPILAWIVDDTGFPKKGKHSVGVKRQYCGPLGKQDNCQCAVAVSVATLHASLPVAYRLYVPQEWVDDRKRRTRAGIPEEAAFQNRDRLGATEGLDQDGNAQRSGARRCGLR